MTTSSLLNKVCTILDFSTIFNLSTSNMNQSWKHSILGGGGENYLNVLSVMQSVAAFQRGIGAVLRTCGLPDTIFRKRSQRREKKSNLI